MRVSETYRSKIITWYCIIFYALMICKWLNGMFLYQLHPFLFYTRPDFITWLFMQTGIHTWLLNNYAGDILFDALFYSMPLLFFIAYKKAKKLSAVAAIVMLIINWLYIQCYTLYPSTSIEGKTAWLLFPLIFIPQNIKTFELLFRGLRYFFLFFFASSGVWKIAQGGLFHTDQMSGVLLLQHKDFLAHSPQYWYTRFIYWLMQHPNISYFLYLLTDLIQLSFLTGFFTSKFDKWLIAAFIIFLFMDNFIMRISYYDTLPFLLTLSFSRSSLTKNYAMV